jgi:hypothetical protein
VDELSSLATWSGPLSLSLMAVTCRHGVVAVVEAELRTSIENNGAEPRTPGSQVRRLPAMVPLTGPRCFSG